MAVVIARGCVCGRLSFVRLGGVSVARRRSFGPRGRRWRRRRSCVGRTRGCMSVRLSVPVSGLLCSGRRIVGRRRVTRLSFAGNGCASSPRGVCRRGLLARFRRFGLGLSFRRVRFGLCWMVGFLTGFVVRGLWRDSCCWPLGHWKDGDLHGRTGGVFDVRHPAGALAGGEAG